LKVTGGDLKVTVKANVDGRDAVPAVFTFTQLPPIESPIVVGSGDALMEGNMLDVPPGDTVAVNVSLQNMMGEDPGVSWTISTEGDGTLLIVDMEGNMLDLDDPADAVNDSVNTLPPAAAGDTIKVQLFVEDAGGVVAVGFDAKFADSNMEAMFTDSWKIVGFDGIFNVPLAVGPDVLTLTYFAPGVVGVTEVPANGYIGTVEVVAQTDIGEGAYFYVSKADIGTGAGLDSLDTSAAR
jgi:hypothetical protein